CPLCTGSNPRSPAWGAPPKDLVKKSMSLWLLFWGLGLVLGAPVLIDQATIRPVNGATNGFFEPVMLVWKPVVLPTAWQLLGHDGAAGVAAPSTCVRGAASALPTPRAIASRVAKTATAEEMPSLCRRAGTWTSRPMSFIEHPHRYLVAGWACNPNMVSEAMTSESAFQSYLEGALETFGIEADEAERVVMKGVWAVYEPAMEMLRDADLRDVEPETDVDLSRAPSG